MNREPVLMELDDQALGCVTLYPLECQGITRIADMSGGYIVFGDEYQKLGLMDWRGHVIIRPMWEDVRLYVADNVVACTRGRTTVLFNLQGETLTGLPLDTLLSEPHPGFTAIAKGGKPTVLTKLGDFSEGMARAYNDLVPVMVDHRGRYVSFAPDYDGIGECHDGLALAVKIGGLFKKDKVGYIDTLGRTVLPPVYREGRNFSEGLAAVRTKEGWRYVRKDGTFLECYEMVDGQKKPVIAFTQAFDFQNGYATVLRMGRSVTLMAGDGLSTSVPVDVGGWGLLSATGEVTVPTRFNRLSDVQPGGVCVFEDLVVDGKPDAYGLVTPQGQVRYRNQYWPLGVLGSGYFAYQNGDKMYILDRDGRPVSDQGWDEVGRYVSEDMLSVKKNGRWGVLGGDGRMVAPCGYEMPFNFCGGVAFVKQYDEFFLVGRDGQPVSSVRFSDGGNLDWGLGLVTIGDTRYTLDFGYSKQPGLKV